MEAVVINLVLEQKLDKKRTLSKIFFNELENVVLSEFFHCRIGLFGDTLIYFLFFI